MKLLLILTLALASFAHAKINRGDILLIMIKGVPEQEQKQVNGNYSVSSSTGKIHLPYLSTKPIKANGLSADKLARIIEAAYKSAEIYTTPTISIQSLTAKMLEEKRAKNKMDKFLTVSGKVARPGPQPFRPGMKLIDVVSAASPTTFAAQNRVELLRNGKIYKYNMKKPSHMMVRMYANDQVTLKEKTAFGK